MRDCDSDCLVMSQCGELAHRKPLPGMITEQVKCMLNTASLQRFPMDV